MDDAASRYDSERQGLGQEFLDELQTVFSKIGTNPRYGGWLLAAVRQCVADRFPHKVIYTAGEPGRIFAIAHGSRQPNYWRKRMSDRSLLD